MRATEILAAMGRPPVERLRQRRLQRAEPEGARGGGAHLAMFLGFGVAAALLCTLSLLL